MKKEEQQGKEIKQNIPLKKNTCVTLKEEK